MKGKKVMIKDKFRSAVSLAVAAQLALSLSPLCALGQTEPAPLSNNSIPLAQPAPSQLVQKIWGSIDPRRFRAKKEIAAKIPVTESKKEVETAPSETKQSSASATSTGGIVFETAVPNKPEEIESNKASSINLQPQGTAQEPVTEASNSSAQKNAAQEITEAKSTQTENKTQETTAQSAPTAPTPEQKSLSADSENTEKRIEVASNLISLPPGSVLSRVQAQSNNECLVVDNDEVEEVEETIKQEEIPTDEGKTRATAGARFPVVLSSQITSKTAKKGDPIQARLKYDLKIGDRLVAKKGSLVNGHVNYVLKARTILHSLVSPERWYRNSGCIGLSFDEIINERGEHLPLSAQPSRQARIVKNKAEGRELGVNHYGQVTGPWAQQLRYKAVRIGLNAALAPAGVFSFGAMPVALGVLGAANPSFAFSRPVGLNVRHRRIKGFAWGFLSGIPGSWLIEDTTVKGQEAIIKPGDEFYAELVQEFTGEPASDAQLMPGASTKLHGQILKDPKKDSKKKK